MKGFNTKAVHEGELIDKRFGNVVTPIFQTSTFLYPNEYVEAYRDPFTGNTYLYTRESNPTLTSLELKYASLENAKYGISFSSGMASISSVLLSLIRKGTKILAINQLYGRTYTLLNELKSKEDIEVDFVSVRAINSLDINNKKYDIIYVESITNPTVQVVDMVELGKYSYETGSKLIVDATFASPYNQQPLDLKAKIVVHSGTKYISGHSDVVIGLSATNDEEMFNRIINVRRTYGGIPDPFSAYLTLRGIKTLGLRMEKHNKNAME
ncbi:cystathionine gamma-lyase, partial [Sulfolobus sp. E5]